MSFNQGKNPVKFTCRDCGKNKQQRRTFYEARIGTPYEGLCLECGAKVDKDVVAFNLSLSGRVVSVTKKTDTE